MMEPKPRCLGSIFVSIYRVTKGRDCNRSTQVFGKLAALSLHISLPAEEKRGQTTARRETTHAGNCYPVATQIGTESSKPLTDMPDKSAR